jgi:hypothetical protein
MTNVDTTVGQTGRSTRGRTPVWRFTVNGVELDAVVLEAQLQFSKNQHDLVTMTLSSETMTDTEGLTDMPVFFAFGQSPRIETYFGYIAMVAETTANTTSFQFAVVITGVTRVMQGGQPRFWRDRTIPGAVQELVMVNALGYAGQEHPHKWKALAQTSESDWAAILRFAKRLGWDVYNRFGVVMCHDPERIFNDQGAYTNLVGGSEDEYNTQDQRLILDFDASEESDETPDTLGHKMGYFNGDKPQMVTQAGKFQRYRFSTDIVIRDQAESEIYRTSFDLADSYDTQKASVRTYGEADLYPGMSVDVTTSNARLYRGRFDGRWLIDSVHHKMDRASFQTQLTLSRPGKGQVRSIAYRSFWDLLGKSKPTMFLDSTGGWVSTWSDRRVQSLAGGIR